MCPQPQWKVAGGLRPSGRPWAPSGQDPVRFRAARCPSGCGLSRSSVNMRRRQGGRRKDGQVAEVSSRPSLWCGFMLLCGSSSGDQLPEDTSPELRPPRSGAARPPRSPPAAVRGAATGWSPGAHVASGEPPALRKLRSGCSRGQEGRVGNPSMSSDMRHRHPGIVLSGGAHAKPQHSPGSRVGGQELGASAPAPAGPAVGKHVDRPAPCWAPGARHASEPHDGPEGRCSHRGRPVDRWRLPGLEWHRGLPSAQRVEGAEFEPRPL
uniref:Uncharacterized protein n=1 Tax=Molossus molossus TaxID=27622 RepID=A0A7J8HHN2_MOLMO|nr:hypothetical protein HJG59_010932 [Molossus molossus]